MHWHLDVTFREDANTTLDKQAAQNQNIIRKWSQGILKRIEIMKPELSLKKKRFAISIWKKYYLFKRYGLNNLGDKSIHAVVLQDCSSPLYSFPRNAV